SSGLLLRPAERTADPAGGLVHRAGCPGALAPAPLLVQPRWDGHRPATAGWDASAAAPLDAAADVSQGLPDATAEKSVARVPAFPVLNVLAPQRHRSRLGSGRGLCTPDAARCAKRPCAALRGGDCSERPELQPALTTLLLSAVWAPFGL